MKYPNRDKLIISNIINNIIAIIGCVKINEVKRVLGIINISETNKDIKVNLNPITKYLNILFFAMLKC